MKVLSLWLSVCIVGAAAQPERPNVLLVISDDLRAELPCYGCGHVVAPHTTRLARGGLTFRAAYAQEALCAPSRNSFLSGRRPDATRAWQFRASFRDVGPDWTTLPGAFREAGYAAVGCGKVFHPHLPPNWDLARSWDPRMNATWADWFYPREPRCPGNTTFCAVPDDAVFEDTQTTAVALDLLKNVTADAGRNWFLAVGYRKPHLQWRVPERVAALYPGGANATSVSPRAVAPEGAPGLAFHIPRDELAAFSDVSACGGPLAMAPGAAFSASCQRDLRYGYYAAVSFVDEQLGALLDALDARRLAANALVAFVGDHGWHLGDQGEWEKFTNYENAVRTPLLIRAPWLPQAAGRAVPYPVELVDLMPTLAGLAGVDVAYVANESAPLGGRDLSGFFLDPDAVPGDDRAALSTFPRCVGGEQYNREWASNASYPDWYLNDCNDVPASRFTHMGYAARDARWRLVAWYAWRGDVLRPGGAPVALELYDHAGDDGTCTGGAFDFETTNLAYDPAYASVAARRLAALEAAFGISPS